MLVSGRVVEQTIISLRIPTIGQDRLLTSGKSPIMYLAMKWSGKETKNQRSYQSWVTMIEHNLRKKNSLSLSLSIYIIIHNPPPNHSFHLRGVSWEGKHIIHNGNRTIP